MPAACPTTRRAACGSSAAGSLATARPIYGTRALGLATQPSWGYLTRSKAGDRVYCIVRHWPADGRLDVPLDRPVRAAATMNSAALVRVAGTRPGSVTLDLGQTRPPDAHASVVVLTVG